MASKFVQGNWLLPNNVNANKQSNYSFDFNGSSYIDTGFVPKDNITSAFTFSAWVNASSVSSSNAHVIFGTSDYISPYSNFFFGITRQSASYFYYYSIGGRPPRSAWQIGLNRPEDEFNFSLNTWHHLVFLYDGTNIKLYNNGSLVSTRVLSDPILNYPPHSAGFNGNSYIGGVNDSRYSGVTQQFAGKIDELSIFSRALTDGTNNTANEIASLYNSGTPGNPFDLSGDPIAYYKLGETAIGQAPGGTWNWQIPNHAQSQFSWQMQGGTSPRLAPGTTPKQLGTTHTLSTWFNASTSAASGFFYSLSNINQGSIQTQAITPYSGLVINDNGAYVSSSTQDIRYRVNNVDLIFTIPANIDVTDGNWHNVILVRTGGTAKCYLDGQEITNPTGSLSSTEEFAFELLSSTSRGGATPQWPGKISNFAVWKSDQSANKDNIYNSGEPQNVYTATPDYWWKLDNSSTTNVLSNLVSKNSSISTYPYSERCIVMSGGLSYNTSGGGPSLMFANEVNLGESNSISIWMSGFDLQDQYINNGHIYGGLDQYKWGIFGNTNGSFIVSKFTNATTWKLWYYLGVNSGEYVELTIDQSTYPSVFTTIVSSNFYNLLFVRDGNNLEVFFNNSSIGTGTFTLGESTNTLVNAIGRDGNDTSTPINNGYKMGKSLALDDVTLFNKALSASERITLYNNGKPGDNTSLSPTAWIRMGDDVDVANNRLIDYSGNSNHVNFSNWDQLYVRDIESVTSIGSTSQSLALAATELGLHNPLYSQFSNFFNNTASDRISIPYVLPTGTTKFSVSIWGNVEGAGSSVNKCLISNSNNIAADGYAIVTEGTNPNPYIRFKVENTNVDTTATITFGEWFHVLATYDNGTAKVYINGVLDVTVTGIAAINTSTLTSTVIGHMEEGAAYPLPMLGHLDEAAIWSGITLTDSQAAQIYNNGKPSNISSLSPTNWWRLGDSSYTNSSNYYVFPNKIANAPDGIGNAVYKPSISADAPKVVAPGVSSGLVELDKKGDAPNSTSNAISYNILKTDQSVYTPKYVTQYTVDNNYSMAFNGTSDYFDIGTGLKSTFDAATKASVSLWFKASSISSTVPGILFQQESTDAGNNWLFVIRFSTTGQLQTGIKVGSSYPIATYTTSVNTGNWYNVVSVYDGSTLKLYLNGAKVAENLSTGSPLATSSSSAKAMIGATAVPNRYFNGQIDELAIFDKELTANQIKFDIYEASTTANKSADFINNPNLPTPVAWYRMGD